MTFSRPINFFNDTCAYYPHTCQYVQWVQSDKLRLIKESLSSSEQSTAETIKEDEGLLEKRWEVSPGDPINVF